MKEQGRRDGDEVMMGCDSQFQLEFLGGRLLVYRTA